MRVALVSTFPPTRGGEAQYFLDLAESLSEISEAFAISSSDETARQVEKHGKLEIDRAWQLDSPFYPLQIARACGRVRPDVVHVNCEYMIFGSVGRAGLLPLLLMLLKLRRYPIVVTMHSTVAHNSLTADFFRRYGQERGLFLKRILFNIWTRLLVRLSDHLIVHCEDSKKILVSDYGCPVRKISIIRHGVASMPIIKTETARNTLGLIGQPIVLSLGFLTEKKGLETLLSAMRKVSGVHPNSLLVIAGGSHGVAGSEERRFEQYSTRLARIVHEFSLERNVQLRVGYVPDDLVPTYLASADVIALPYIEGFGGSGVLALAMATGRPVVAAKVSPFPEEIKPGENGILVDPKNDAQLADAILRLFGDASLRQSLGTRLQKDSERLGWNRVAGEHMDVYSRLVSESKFGSS